LQYQVADPCALFPVELAFGWGRIFVTERASFAWRGLGRGANDGWSSAKSAIGATVSAARFRTRSGAVPGAGPNSIGWKSAGDSAAGAVGGRAVAAVAISSVESVQTRASAPARRRVRRGRP
jgi:hypothetical protein